MKNKTVNCPNCEQDFKEDYEFCPHCGQKAKEELTIGVLFYNTISNYFSVDARFFKSFIPLVFKPGYLAKKFISGKRLLFLHPAQMYLFISVIFFFLFSFVVRNQTKEVNIALKNELNRANIVVDSLRYSTLDSQEIEELLKPIKANKDKLNISDEDLNSLNSIINDESDLGPMINFSFNESSIDSIIKTGASNEDIYKFMGLDESAGSIERRLYAQALKFYKARDGGSILQAFYDTIPIALFFLLPIFALILKLLYFKKGGYSHHLVFSFYFFSFLFTVFGMLVGLTLIWNDFPGWIIALTMFSTFFYLWIAVKRFYGQGWLLSFLKSSVTTIVFLMIVAPIAVIIIGLSVFLFY